MISKKPHAHREGKKNRKFGRNKLKCARYSKEKRHEKSHIRRIQKHMLIYKDDSSMVKEALEKYRKLLLGM